MRQSPHGLSALVGILFPSGAVIPPSRKEGIGQAVINEHVTTRRQLDFSYPRLIVNTIIAKGLAI